MKTNKIVTAALALVALISAPIASAKDYEHHPKSWLSLGVGFNPYRPTDGFAQCVQFDGEEKVAVSGATNTVATMQLLKKREDFYNYINFSASLAGSYKFASGQASYHYESEDAFHEDSLTWIVFFRSDYGIYAMSKPQLKASYKNLPQQTFYETCGSEVVIKHKKTALAYAIFKLKNVSESHRKEIEAHFTMSADAPTWSVDAEAHYKSVLKTAMSASQVELKVGAIGGPGISSLADLVGQQNNEDLYSYYARIPAALKGYVAALNAESAVPLSFQTAPIRIFRPGLPERYTDFKANVVGQLYVLFDHAETTAKRLNELLYGPSRDQYEITGPIEEQLKGRLNFYNQVMRNVENAAKKCFDENGDCRTLNVNLQRVNWPSPKKIVVGSCEQTRRDARGNGCINEADYAWAVDNNQIPLCSSYERGNSGIMQGWTDCQD